MDAWGMTHTGAVRQQNQDAYSIDHLENGVLVGIVCDGMGGAQAGDVASQLAVAEFLAFIRAETKHKMDFEELKSVLKEAVSHANAAVFEQANKCREYQGMGTTLVAAAVYDQTIVVANVGDSRAYLVNASGIKRVTKDHSLVEDMVCRGEITPEEARMHPQKNLITRALGSEPSVECDIFSLEFKSGEYLLLCSDGLVNIVNDQEILYEVIHGGEPENCCQRLLDMTLSRGAPDNVTTVLIRK
jgi:serine/threonine protein phosphatase PrpC